MECHLACSYFAESERLVKPGCSSGADLGNLEPSEGDDVEQLQKKSRVVTLGNGARPALTPWSLQEKYACCYRG